MSARNPDPADPKTNPNAPGGRDRRPRRGSTGGGLDVATAARDHDPPEPRWYTDWVAKTILQQPHHARLLAHSLLSDPLPEATDQMPTPPTPPAPLGSEYYIG